MFFCIQKKCAHTVHREAGLGGNPGCSYCTMTLISVHYALTLHHLQSTQDCCVSGGGGGKHSHVRFAVLLWTTTTFNDHHGETAMVLKEISVGRNVSADKG